ncbi:MAG: type 1 glutamine amidotransferase [Verrucomicrobiota bacterium]
MHSGKSSLLNVGTWMRESDLAYFPSIFSKNPEFALLDGRVQPLNIEEIDGLLLTGGGDISPGFLNQSVDNPEILDSINPLRDEWEFPALRRSLERGIPILAICRGLQVLNVALGGTLHIDIRGHNLPEQKNENCQDLRYDSRRSIVFEKVNSSHHQALDRLGSDLRVEAWHSQDQTVEQARLQGYPFALGTQYHPERHDSYQPIFDLFMSEIKRLKTPSK